MARKIASFVCFVIRDKDAEMFIAPDLCGYMPHKVKNVTRGFPYPTFVSAENAAKKFNRMGYLDDYKIYELEISLKKPKKKDS